MWIPKAKKRHVCLFFPLTWAFSLTSCSWYSQGPNYWYHVMPAFAWYTFGGVFPSQQKKRRKKKQKLGKKRMTSNRKQEKDEKKLAGRSTKQTLFPGLPSLPSPSEALDDVGSRVFGQVPKLSEVVLGAANLFLRSLFVPSICVFIFYVVFCLFVPI